MTHKIKIEKTYADAVLSGDKTFEVRYDDRGYQKGDVVEFNVIDNYDHEINHPLNDKEFEITYVLHGWGIKDGWCVFGIKEAVEHKPECEDCDYQKFTKQFIDGVVDVMKKNGISSVDELVSRLKGEGS